MNMFASVSFIGSGRVARIILGGWKRAGALPDKLLAFDAHRDAVATLQADFPSLQMGSLEEAAAADLVFVAVPPPAVAELLASIAGKLKRDTVLCSLAPKVKLSTLKEELGGFPRLARMNPNAPSIIGQGYNPITFAEDLPESVRSELLKLFQPLGQVPVVAERLLESYAVISAMGPTYFGFQFAEVERLAESFGLSEGAAHRAMQAMIDGTARMLFASDLPQTLALDLVPVRPMAAHENEIKRMLQQDLGGIYGKLTA